MLIKAVNREGDSFLPFFSRMAYNCIFDMKHNFLLLREEYGQSATEFALVLPIILIVILIIIQSGIIVNAQLVITHAAREGVRDGSVTNNNSRVINSIRNSTKILDQDMLNISIHPSSGRKIGDYLTVSIEYKPPIVIPIIKSFFPNNIRLRSSATMRIEKD